VEGVVDIFDFILDTDTCVAENGVAGEIVLAVGLLLTKDPLCFGLYARCWS
jgi:hypothetical protein